MIVEHIIGEMYFHSKVEEQLKEITPGTLFQLNFAIRWRRISGDDET